MGDWAGFFEAELGAAAALAGLVMVAISINIARILAVPSLPGRAAETLVPPTGLLIVCSFALVQHQTGWSVGAEIAATGIAMAVLSAFIIVPVMRSDSGVARRYVVSRAASAVLYSLPFIVCGVLLCLGVKDALYWIVPGVIVSLLTTVLNAWVLLIEILR